jgi:hypothetical protein
MTRRQIVRDGTTTYSGEVRGDDGNHQQAVLFDITDGYVGISQGKDRVLLTPLQWRALKVFVGYPPKR